MSDGFPLKGNTRGFVKESILNNELAYTVSLKKLSIVHKEKLLVCNTFGNCDIETLKPLVEEVSLWQAKGGQELDLFKNRVAVPQVKSRKIGQIEMMRLDSDRSQQDTPN